MFLWAYQHEACSDMKVGAELQVLHCRLINRLTAGVSHCQVRGVEATPPTQTAREGGDTEEETRQRERY